MSLADELIGKIERREISSGWWAGYVGLPLAHELVRAGTGAGVRHQRQGGGRPDGGPVHIKDISDASSPHAEGRRSPRHGSRSPQRAGGDLDLRPDAAEQFKDRTSATSWPRLSGQGDPPAGQVIVLESTPTGTTRE